MEGDESWALVTFRHERSILKAISQPIEAGVGVLIPRRAIFQQVVSMNEATVQIQRGWSADRAEAGGSKTGTGLTGAMAGLKGARAPANKEVRETPEEVAARLNRSLKVRRSIDEDWHAFKSSLQIYVRTRHEDLNFLDFLHRRIRRTWRGFAIDGQPRARHQAIHLTTTMTLRTTCVVGIVERYTTKWYGKVDLSHRRGKKKIPATTIGVWLRCLRCIT